MKSVLIGALFQFAGSLAEVARLIATQRLLQDLSIDPLVALSALSPVRSCLPIRSLNKMRKNPETFTFSTILQICCSMAFVLAPVFEGLQPIFLILPRLGFPIIIASIVLALALNIVVLYLVSCTSALILTLAGQFICSLSRLSYY